MKIGCRIVIIALCTVVLAGAAAFLINLLNSNEADNNDGQKQDEMLALTLEWGRLAPLPDSKREFCISTEGNAFSRSFRSSFYLPESDLADWVMASPGLQDALVEERSNGVKEYIIEPGGGAGYAEAVIDYNQGLVKTYVSWS